MSDTEKPRFAYSWQGECEEAVFNATVLLRMAGRRCVPCAILELLRSVPGFPEEGQWPEESFFMRCAAAARDLNAYSDSDQWKMVFDYFHKLAAMKPKRRALLEASVAGALTGFSMGG